MNVLVAIDSMKGSLTSRQAAEAVRAGVLAACPDAAVETLPVADGGEGPWRRWCRAWAVS